MNRNPRWALLLALLVATPTQAAIWIKDFEGDPEGYRLERNGQTLTIQYYLELKAGDRLLIEPGRELRLGRDDGTVNVVRSDESPYTLEETGEAPSVWANLVAWAGGWLHARHEDGMAKPVVSLHTRNQGKPIALPLAPVSPVQLMAGERPLQLIWTGGQSPFRVRLASADGKTVLIDQSVEKRRLSSPPLNLAPGIYQLTIQDPSQQQATVAINVVAAENLPVPAPGWTAAVGADDSRETLYAVWLAAQGESWLLEAYQRAMLWQDRYKPAEWLLYSLENGARPASPPAPLAKSH